MVIADTSVWIPFFNQPGSPEKREIDALIDADRLVLVGVVLTELTSIHGGAALAMRHLQVRMPNYGWGRDLVGVGLVRTEDLGADISTISRPFHKCSL